ncbi:MULTISPECIES: dihydrolipoamide acetyltransferase family protein [Ensifer]|jgi:2-oxoisovalerate dehydrogenase E2 component (dihydrolipoyl transacylase)|uniref:Dihydrolipoamide acetyltransferase component of pyruvate dehydrogenase complex n=1 Tax=Ensifer canadensis TaxID=555315 RepID=A0AAW4FTU0_9HYPH|nr:MULTISPECIES: dihydrolipoamide acetyltransferase family protein [Ensifer]AHK42522.1 dihydrolipoamide acyltransferase component of branched-chain alpha-keto aciddehydrogenase complex [Ensifer adhaerens OV14]KQU82177.1 branched-chain alpha-keto acid dehydrogenase subunit E2 [Ensifer sp. Root31]KQW55491.1 branched-chain alpha-keto acid dehydrogenase subunit E2 [Ensifer sp. Root1252]KQW73618.1 branched-chain alpha-keto acid dehydrogenase subunit E2 [Ensifer sp. Root127]KQY69760.1 branched-chain
MGEFVIKMPDVGEGVAEAELVEWHVKPGDPVREDMILAAVMTDKATVEIPSPVNGTVLWLGAEIGDTVAVKAPLVRIEIAGEGTEALAAEEKPAAKAEEKPVPKTEAPAATPSQPAKVEAKTAAPAKNGVHVSSERLEKALASPAVRLRARESGVDLRQVTGTGPAGRITHDDLDQFLARGAQPVAVPAGLVRKTAIDEIKVTGLRRRIAEKMTLSTSRIPHITYVEEVDMTALEDLRTMMNRDRKPDQPKLTILPYLMRALVRAIADLPGVNSTFDDGAGIINRHHAVHIGIATQTPAGLTVPVVRHAEARGIWDCAVELNRLAEAARTGTATRDELTGSTITISSLGALGGIVTTPVINHPEVAIVGVNKLAVRPVWDGAQFVPRKIMNLSSSFDHRVIDGWDAATFVQRLKALLETPALIFVEA